MTDTHDVEVDRAVLVDHLDIRLKEPKSILPRCKACGEIICSHPDAVFNGRHPCS